MRHLGLFSALLLLVPASLRATPVRDPEPRVDVNFAVAGATTGTLNLVDVFEPGTTAVIRAAGLDTGGIQQQLDLAFQTLFDVDGAQDVFFVAAGANDYLAGTRDPSLPSARIGAALEALYQRFGARTFIVPNLLPLGFFPVLRTRPPEQAAGLNILTVLHNQALATMLAQFSAAHPDAVVVSVDFYSVFLGLLGSYSDITSSCVEDRLPFALSCDGLLFFDSLHLETGANAAFGAAAASRFRTVAGPRAVRRIITFGDSLSDSGAFFDTTRRATGAGVPPSPPYFMGRFSNGPIGIDVIEWLLGVEAPSSFFSQPFRATIVALPSSGKHQEGGLELRATVFVPDIIGASGSGRIHLDLGQVHCVYSGNGAGFLLESCSKQARAGSRIPVEEVTVKATTSTQDPVTVHLLYYERP
jgi:lysophospholipase L1-like esterase